jgi:hypothetical protein
LYDANPVSLKKIKSNLDEDEELYFITCGCGKISACTLWILREFPDKKINIVYIKPDVTSIDDKSRMINRAHFHILQEYTRSGIFEKMYIINNKKMPEIIGKTSLLNFYPKINNFIASTIHWLNIYINTEPVFDTYRDEYITSRICSLAILDLNEEQMTETYSLKKCNQIKYFYGVNRITIEKDEDLIEKLNRITSQNSEDVSVSYGVYSTDLEVGFSLAVRSSSDIQEEV